MTLQQDNVLVLFSGGQDSTTCLAWALEKFAAVETIGFDYGQRHRAELDARPKILAGVRKLKPAWKKKLAADHVFDLGVLGEISETALTREAEIKLGQDGLPTTFVPGRNLLFLTLSAAMAYRRGIGHLVGGMCETDYSGYPDCRDETIKAMGVALNLGMAREFMLHTPLMWIDKAATWALALDLGGRKLVELIIEETVSCYRGASDYRHDWGYGCGTCPACGLRARGFAAFAGGHNAQAKNPET
jgi:7-cyano-7-deazaguanine synthase